MFSVVSVFSCFAAKSKCVLIIEQDDLQTAARKRCFRRSSSFPESATLCVLNFSRMSRRMPILAKARIFSLFLCAHRLGRPSASEYRWNLPRGTRNMNVKLITFIHRQNYECAELRISPAIRLHLAVLNHVRFFDKKE
jgi:hypothetical protein